MTWCSAPTSYRRGYDATVFRPKIDAGLGWLKGGEDGAAADLPDLLPRHPDDREDRRPGARHARPGRGADRVRARRGRGGRDARRARRRRWPCSGTTRGCTGSTLADRLAERWPDRWADVTGDAVSAQCREPGVPVGDGIGSGVQGPGMPEGRQLSGRRPGDPATRYRAGHSATARACGSGNQRIRRSACGSAKATPVAGAGP